MPQGRFNTSAQPSRCKGHSTAFFVFRPLRLVIGRRAHYCSRNGVYRPLGRQRWRHVPMMDEIRRQCALLLSDDFSSHSAAYSRLRRCRAFQRLVERFRQHDLTMFDVAAALVPGSDGPHSTLAVKMLGEFLADEGCK